MQIAVGASLQHPSKNPLYLPQIFASYVVVAIVISMYWYYYCSGISRWTWPAAASTEAIHPTDGRVIVWWWVVVHAFNFSIRWGLGRFASCSRSPLSTRSTRILLFIIEQRRSFQIEWVGFTNLEFIASLGGAEVIVAMIEQISHRQGICSLRSAAAATAIR